MRYLEIASIAHHQSAIIAMGYHYRSRRNDSSASVWHRYVASTHESSSFEKAAACSAENTNRELTPWSDEELCAEAKKEILEANCVESQLLVLHHNEVKKAEAIHAERDPSWGLVAAAGVLAFIISDFANNSPKQLSDAQRYQDAEERRRRQRESSWAHVGAAMFVK